MADGARAAAPRSWYLVLHHLPPRPLYLRAKVLRRLERAGAVPLKSAAYALPLSPRCRRELEAVAADAVRGGGDAYLCRATLLDREAEVELVARFRRAREDDYASLAARLETWEANRDETPPAARAAELSRIRRRLARIAAIDFFDAPGRSAVERRLERLGGAPVKSGGTPAAEAGGLAGRVWATRKGVAIDRMATAWLVRRFVDPSARFRFVSASQPPRGDEIRFDMPGGRFTHEGDACTFEALLARVESQDPALRAIAEIVHDVDLKDGKFGRPEAPGVERLVLGILASESEDEARLARGFALFDQLYASFRGPATGAAAPRRPAPSRNDR